jgi:hypothetical protein
VDCSPAALTNWRAESKSKRKGNTKFGGKNGKATIGQKLSGNSGKK